MLEQKITFDKFIRWSLIAACVFVVLLTVNYLSQVLLPFFIAWFFAYLLYPAVKFVQDKLHVKVRAIAIIITMIVVIAVIGGIVYLIIPPMIEQFQKLGDVLTRWVQQTTHTNNLTQLIREWARENQRELEQFFHSKDFSDAVKASMPKLFTLLSQTANIVLSIIGSCIVLLYMFFILLDYEYLTDNWIKIFPKKNRPFWHVLMSDVKREMNNYIRGQGLVALCMGIMFCIGFSIIDFPMAVGLGMLIGLLNMVPYLQIVGFVPTVLLAIVKAADSGENFWIVLLMALIVFAVVQIIQDTILTPRIMGKVMGLNSAIILLSLSIWGSLLGMLGMVIALPLTTLLITYYQKYIVKKG